MAVCYVNKTNYDSENSCDIGFDGGLQSDTRATLVNELIKYFLYERQQIPLPYANVKRDVKQSRERKENENILANRSVHISRLDQKLAMSVVANAEQIFSHVYDAFDACSEIRQVIIIIGSISVSPKECYHIHLPLHRPDADPLSHRSCIKSMFRQMIAHDMLGSYHHLSPTNTILLLNAPRDCAIKWFTPKSTYKVPSRGQHFVLNLMCRQPLDLGQDLSQAELGFDMSGVEPLESSGIDCSMSERELLCIDDVLMRDCDSSPKSAAINPSSDTSASLSSFGSNWSYDEGAITSASPMNDAAEAEDYIWFQAPINIKGYKDRSSKPVTSGTSWM